MNNLNFNEEYNKLNDLQKEAVDSVEGPVMVIAGPGTGKTQILSRRVANLMVNHNAKPEEIVCLTYTEAGASEMLDRLSNLIGEQGRNVRVSTIHSFCNDIILANPNKFGDRPKIISYIEKYEILREVMDEYIREGHKLYRSSGKRYNDRDRILSLFEKMKREDLSKDDIRNEVNEHIKEIEFSEPGEELYKTYKYRISRGENKKGDFKVDFFDLEDKFNVLLSATDIAEIYQNIIEEKNYFDFDDMIRWTIDVFKEDKQFLKEISNDIKYLFVDEFQDTSIIQNELLDLLMSENQSKNIFVVGDDDQSIYRFQNVSETNIIDFDTKYNPKKIVLEANYRSAQHIIDAATAIIRKNKNREDKNLIASGQNKDYVGDNVTLTEYETESEEMLGTLARIKELIANDVSPNEIGVIYGRNNYGENFAKVLLENGIYVDVNKDSNLFEDPFAQKILAILRYIAKPSRNINQLRNILYFDFFELSLEDLLAIRDIKEYKDINISRIKNIDKKLEKLRIKLIKSKKHLPITYILQSVMREFDIDSYVMQSKNKYHLVAVWRELYNIMSLEMAIKPTITLGECLVNVDMLNVMEIKLPIEQAGVSSDKCVQLMTAHGSKGREFDYVFMLKCQDGTNKTGKKSKWPGGENNSTTFKYPPSISGNEDNEKELKEAEDRRLFYVAMTRAKKELHLSYSKKSDGKISEDKRTRFIDDLEGYLSNIDEYTKDNEYVANTGYMLPKIPQEIVDDIVKDINISASLLNSFLSCPLSFYFNKGLSHEAQSNESMSFGNIVHRIFEEIYGFNSGDATELSYKDVLSKEKTLQLFKEIYEKESKNFLTERIRRDNKLRGINIINNFYEKGYINSGIIAVEKKIPNIRLGDINLDIFKDKDIEDIRQGLLKFKDFKITGKIDKIELEDNNITITDYKTGNHDNKVKKKINKPENNEDIGGNYWRQAVFYHILLTNSEIDTTDKNIKVNYIFVEGERKKPGDIKEEVIEVTANDVAIVLRQIIYCLEKLTNGDFNCNGDHANNEYDCEYCGKYLLNANIIYDDLNKVEIATFKETVDKLDSLSVSSLNKFLNCNNCFYFDNVLKLTEAAGLSSGKKEHKEKIKVNHAPTGAVFGTVMHETMEAIYRDNLNLEDAIKVFDNSLNIHETEIIDIMSADDLRSYGHHLINNLFEEYIPNSRKDVLLEGKINATLDDKYAINGIIDKIEFDGDVIRIVDYKTGSELRGVEELEYDRDYWRQAVFYNIMLKENPQVSIGNKIISIDIENKTIQTRYVFLDDTTNTSGYSVHDIEVTEEDIEKVKSQIKEFWDTVRTANFNSGCQKEDCDYCKLSKFVDFNLLK